MLPFFIWFCNYHGAVVCLGEEIIGQKCFKISSSQSLGPFLALQTISARTPQKEWRDVACCLLSTCMAVLLLPTAGFPHASLCLKSSSFFPCWGKIFRYKTPWRIFSGICSIWFPGGSRLHRLHHSITQGQKALSNTARAISYVNLTGLYSPAWKS